MLPLSTDLGWRLWHTMHDPRTSSNSPMSEVENQSLLQKELKQTNYNNTKNIQNSVTLVQLCKELVNQQNVNPSATHAFPQFARVNQQATVEVCPLPVQIFLNWTPAPQDTNHILKHTHQRLTFIYRTHSFSKYFNFSLPHQRTVVVEERKWLAWEPAIVATNSTWQAGTVSLQHVCVHPHLLGIEGP